MKWLILLLAFPFLSFADEYQFDISTTKLEHGWRGVSVAQFEAKLTGIGLTYWHDTGFGIRAGYIFGGKLHTKGRYESYIINLKRIASIELLYRYEIIDRLYFIAGIRTSKIHLPITSIKEDYYRNESDDDEGWGAKLEYRVYKNISIGAGFDHFSKIKSKGNNEWIKGCTFYIAGTF